MTSTMTDKDKGAVARLAAIMELKRRVVEVGVLGDRAAAEAAGESGKTVADIATYNEFGLGVPKRSFIRGYVDENRQPIGDLMVRMCKAVAAGKLSAANGFTALGLKLAANIQERISRGIAPANAPETIKRKGSSKPLINTGQLRSSIVPRVVSR